MRIVRAFGLLTAVVPLLIATHSAEARPIARLMAEAGLVTWSQQFDLNGESQDLAKSVTEIPLAIGFAISPAPNTWIKLGLTMVNRSNGTKKRFGVRELKMGASHIRPLAPRQSLRIAVGFKLDIAPLPQNIDDAILSNDQNAIEAELYYRFRINPMFMLRIGLDLVYNLEAINTTYQDGVVFHPQAGVRIFIGKQAAIGLDIGYVVSTTDTLNGVDQKNTSMGALSLRPSFRWLFTKRQSVLLSVGGQLENMNVGIPVYGKSFPAYLIGFNLRYVLTL